MSHQIDSSMKLHSDAPTPTMPVHETQPSGERSPASIRETIGSAASDLKSAGITLGVRLASYESSRKTTETKFAGHPDAQIAHDFAGANWKVDLQCQTAMDRFGGEDFFLTLTSMRPTVAAVAFALEFEIRQWTREHFVVMPGAVYGGNRFASRAADYPPTAAATGDVGVDLPTIINDIPRLSDTAPRSLLQQLTGDLSTPAIGVFNPETQTGVWLLTGQNTRLGQTGLDVEENLETGRAILRCSAPGVREGTRYHCFRTDRPSPDRAHFWQENEAAVLQVRAFVFSCKDRPAFLARFLEIRSCLAPPGQRRSLFPLSAARALIEEKQNRDNWHEQTGIFCSDTLANPSTVWNQPLAGNDDDRETRDPVNATWQAGWIGGGIIEWPLRVQGDASTRERAGRSLDFICTEAVSPAGFFRGFWRNGSWMDDAFGHPAGAHWHLTRKSADLLFFLSKQILHAGGNSPQSWKSATRSCVEAFLRLWQKHGQIGQFVDEENGELKVGGSDAAAILPAALCAAAKALAEPGWIAEASGIGDHFWQRFQRYGFTTGGPGEILSAPDSESAFGLLESLLALYESTGNPVWLTRAESAAALCASWCVSYDFAFPTASTFGALNISTTGTVIANVQNKHASPGICTLSGDSLLRLFRATGKTIYLDLIRDIATALPQFVSRSERPILARLGGRLPVGWMCERVNLSDWLEPVGEIFHGSCWCEVSLQLTALEIPSIYFQPDTGLISVLDHLDVRPMRGADGGWVLEITNPTSHPASVKVLREDSIHARQSLPVGTVSRLPSFLIEPGATIHHA
jgi:hypothetical protein